MDPQLTSGPSSHSHYSEQSRGNNGQVDPASLSKAEYPLGNNQSNGSAVLYPSPPTPLYVSEYLPIPQSVQNAPNDQWPSYPPPSSPLKDLSFEIYPNDFDAFHVSPTQGSSYATHWDDSNLPMGQRETVSYLDYHPPSPLQDSQGDSGPSDPPGRTVDKLSSELYPQFMVQYDYPYVTSSPYEQVEAAAQNHMATQGQYATTRQASGERERKAVKKEKDKERKRDERFNDDRVYARICELLEIESKPKNKLANRILDAVEELVEQRKVDSDLRERLRKTEAYVHLLTTELSDGLLPSHRSSHYAG